MSDTFGNLYDDLSFRASDVNMEKRLELNRSLCQLLSCSRVGRPIINTVGFFKHKTADSESPSIFRVRILDNLAPQLPFNTNYYLTAQEEHVSKPETEVLASDHFRYANRIALERIYPADNNLDCQFLFNTRYNPDNSDITSLYPKMPAVLELMQFDSINPGWRNDSEQEAPLLPEFGTFLDTISNFVNKFHTSHQENLALTNGYDLYKIERRTSKIFYRLLGNPSSPTWSDDQAIKKLTKSTDRSELLIDYKIKRPYNLRRTDYFWVNSEAAFKRLRRGIASSILLALFTPLNSVIPPEPGLPFAFDAVDSLFNRADIQARRKDQNQKTYQPLADIVNTEIHKIPNSEYLPVFRPDQLPDLPNPSGNLQLGRRYFQTVDRSDIGNQPAITTFNFTPNNSTPLILRPSFCQGIYLPDNIRQVGDMAVLADPLEDKTQLQQLIPKIMLEEKILAICNQSTKAVYIEPGSKTKLIVTFNQAIQPKKPN